MRMKALKAYAKRGFTLVELLVVIVIIGILAGGIFMMTRSANTKSAEAKTISQVHAIASLLNEYKAVYGDYPLVTATDENGYASLNFTFVANKDSCDACGANMNDDGVAFGLCSHFVPRATTIFSWATSETNMHNYYKDMFENPDGQGDDTAFSREYRGTKSGSSDAWEVIQDHEREDANIQQIYRSWRRLKNQGLVFEKGFSCEQCEVLRFSAGAESDGWGHALKYRNEGGAGEIVSAGPDGIFGTADDIVSGGASADEDETYDADDDDE